MDNEDQLVGQLEQGNDQALGELFELHRPRLQKLLEFRMDRRLRGRVDVEDILQEAYLAAASRIEHYRAHSRTFVLYLAKIDCQSDAH